MLKFVVLGLVQGLTEFLPVSSSGHLVIFQKFLNINERQLALDIILHLGTLLALMVFFYKEIFNLLLDFSKGLLSITKGEELRSIWRNQTNFRLPIYIAVLSVFTGLIGILGRKFFEPLFSSTRAVAGALGITAFILIKTKKKMRGQRKAENFNLGDSFVLGLVQGFSVVPGISRSGTTISALLFRGVEREEAFQISFLASIPAVLGAFLINLAEAKLVIEQYNFIDVFAGFMVSFLVGLLALKTLKAIIKKVSLQGFGYYCFAIAVLLLILNV